MKSTRDLKFCIEDSNDLQTFFQKSLMREKLFFLLYSFTNSVCFIVLGQFFQMPEVFALGCFMLIAGAALILIREKMRKKTYILAERICRMSFFTVSLPPYLILILDYFFQIVFMYVISMPLFLGVCLSLAAIILDRILLAYTALLFIIMPFPVILLLQLWHPRITIPNCLLPYCSFNVSNCPCPTIALYENENSEAESVEN